MSSAREEFDAIVIGSGATGGLAAKLLTEAGLDVLVLEAGRALDPTVDLNADVWSPELRYRGGLGRLRVRQPAQARHPAFHRRNHHLFVDEQENPYTCPEDAPFLWIRARQLGGRSLLWMGGTPRMSDYELKAASHDGLGVDWPLAHADLEPHYRMVERLLGVMGTAEGLRELPDGAFAPPSPMTAAETKLKEIVASDLGDRRVIHARGVPVRTATWGGPDRPWPPFSSVGTTLAAAERTGRLTLRCDAVVRRIVAGKRRAEGVEIVDRRDGTVHRRFARLVILCASTIESVRLLFNSASSDHPEGLGNSSGLLGTHLMDHVAAGVDGWVPGFENVGGVEEWNGPNGVYVPRFRNLSAPTAGFARGYGVWGRVQRGPPRPDGHASVRFAAHGEMLARRESRITVDPDVRDAWGIPVARIAMRYGDNERALLADAQAEAAAMVRCLGGTVERSSEFAPGQSVHEVGGARMGNDPASSVVDPFGRLWDLDNAYVGDGASWPSSGYQNPTLTMMALTARACRAAMEGR